MSPCTNLRARCQIGVTENQTESNLKFMIGIRRSSWDRMLKLSVMAEEAGFDAIRIGDHLTAIITAFETAARSPVCYDPWVMLNAFAMATKRPKLFLCVTDPHGRRHPATLAQSLFTLDQVSRGRAMLGIGAGEAMNLKPYGLKQDRPLLKMKELVDVIRKLSYNTPINYAGETISLENAQLDIVPFENHCPDLIISAFSPKTRELAGSIADGWVTAATTLEMFESDLREVLNARRSADLSAEKFAVICDLDFAVADSYNEALEIIKNPSRSYLLSHPKQLERIGYSVPREFDYQTMVPNQETENDVRKHLDSVPLEAVEKTAVLGTADDCIAKIEKYQKAGATWVSFKIRGNQETQLRKIKEKIIPYFMQRRSHIA